MSKPAIAELDRFLQKAGPQPEDTMACWEWQGRRSSKGYGQFVSATGLSERAHRASFRLFIGPLPKGLHILHSCDNPCCVNPKHLHLGTDAENMKERDARGRGCFPGNPRHPQTKLTYDQVAAIRSTYAAGRASGRKYGLLAELGRQYGINRSSVLAIVQRGTWKENNH